MSDYSIARQKMVDGQVRTFDVTDLRILDAMLAVPRELFVAPQQRPMAYLDLDLNVAPGSNRCLIKAAVLAKMLQAAEITPTDAVLVVGCATGYSAAVVAKLCHSVCATEADPILMGMAQEALARLGLENVTLQAAAPADGAPASAPYDVIVLDGATEVAPEGLYSQLRDGGRLVGVYATLNPSRAAIVTRSQSDYGLRPLFDAKAPTLPGMEKGETFVF